MLYPVLHRLERQGHVAAKWSASENGRRRKYYRITREGRAQLAAQRQHGGGRRDPAEYLDEGMHGMTTFADRPLEEQIAQWRGYCAAGRRFTGPTWRSSRDIYATRSTALTEAGLAGDEAFLVAVKRMGSLDALSREFARAHSERLWKQLVVAPDAADEPANTARAETLVFLSLAVAAALAMSSGAVRSSAQP